MRSRGQPQSRAQFLEIGLDLGGFGVALDLLGMGLADIDDGPAFQVVQGDLGGSLARQRFSGCHRPPPFRGERRGRRVGAAAWSTGSAGRSGVVASTRASEESSGKAAGAAWAGGDCPVESASMTSVVFLRVGETLLAPACQLQEDLGRDYRMR